MERVISGVQRTKLPVKRYRLTFAQLDRVQVEINAVLERMGLERTIQLDPKKSLVDHLSIEANSKKTYEKHLRGLFYFLSLIQDYESLLILLPDAPENAPAMNIDSIRKIVRDFDML